MDEEKQRILAQQPTLAQILASRGLPVFPPEVVEQLEQRRKRSLYWRWPAAKARVRGFWERLIAPWQLDQVPNPNAAGLPSDRVTYQLVRGVVQTMVNMANDATRTKEIQKRNFELLWGAMRVLAQQLDVDLVKELKSELQPGEIDGGVLKDIRELQRMLGLDEPPEAKQT